MKTLTPAVVYAPFQVHTMTYYHCLFTRLFREHSITIIVLPVKQFPNSRSSPLTYHARQQMISTAHSNVIVLPLPDSKGVTWVKNIEQLVHSTFPGLSKFELYTALELVKEYTANQGVWFAHAEEPLSLTAEAYLRQKLAKNVPVNSDEFRAGAIYANNTRFPISWITVDMAATRGLSPEVLLGQRKNDPLLRFPGGFKDRSDLTLEAAACRELAEETHLVAEENSLIYIGSSNIDDWRYKNDEDGITTAFFEIPISTSAEASAGDDLDKVKWFPIFSIDPDEVIGAHRNLLKRLITHQKNKNG